MNNPNEIHINIKKEVKVGKPLGGKSKGIQRKRRETGEGDGMDTYGKNTLCVL